MELFHATTVAIDGRGLFIQGASGTGKSALALQLMAFGAELVADDQTLVEARDGTLYAQPPAPLAGLIEARGIGLLKAPFRSNVPVAAVVDLDREETERLPPDRRVILLNHDLPLVLNWRSDHFPAGLLHYVRYGRSDQVQG